MNQTFQESDPSRESALVPMDSETQAIVERNEFEPSLERETKALIDAIKTRAQAEVQAAQTLTQETYLSAVRHAREAVEHTQLVNPAELETAAEQLMQEAQNNWQSILEEMNQFGDRLAEAAQAAWDVLTRPKDHP